MKTKLMVALPMLCLFLMSVTPFSLHTNELYADAQELKMTGVYDGNEGYGYNFIARHKDDGSEYMMTFQKVNTAVLEEFDLDSELFVNKKFEITYTVKVVKSKDEYGFDQEDEINTITHLKAL